MGNAFENELDRDVTTRTCTVHVHNYNRQNFGSALFIITQKSNKAGSVVVGGGCLFVVYLFIITISI